MPTLEIFSQKKINVGKFANLKKALSKHGIAFGNGVVEILKGEENLSPKTDHEQKALKDVPDRFRLAGEVEVLGNVSLRLDPLRS
jgi:hypothetical protein